MFLLFVVSAILTLLVTVLIEWHWNMSHNSKLVFSIQSQAQGHRFGGGGKSILWNLFLLLTPTLSVWKVKTPAYIDSSVQPAWRWARYAICSTLMLTSHYPVFFKTAFSNLGKLSNSCLMARELDPSPNSNLL